jgi:hypothetical protein
MFIFQLLNGLLKMGIRSSDLFIDQRRTLLQIAPNVPHWIAPSEH